VWSDQPAYTQLFENQNDYQLTSDRCDGIWEGDELPQLPRIKHPTFPIKRWSEGEGNNYLNEETDSITRGKYPNPARLWEGEPYPIGNGRIAASVFHGSGRDRYALNEVSFWSGGQNAGVINNKGDKSYDHENGPNATSDEFGGYQPIGDLIIDFGSPVARGSFVREIRMDEGKVQSSSTRNGITIRSEAFCSYPDQVMVLHYQANQAGKLNGKILFATQRPDDRVQVTSKSIQLECPLANGMKSVAKAIVRHHGGTLEEHEKHLELKEADSFTLIVAIETNYAMDFNQNFRGEEPEKRIAKRMEAISQLSFEDLQVHHQSDYQALYKRQCLSLGTSAESLRNLPTPKRLEAYRQNPNDPELEEILYNFGRYLMINTSRPGSLPAGLQGIWNGTTHAPWGNDYHSNINLQMVYWLAESGNLSECHHSMLDYLDAMRQPFRQNTREYLTAIGKDPDIVKDGWIVYTSHNPFGAGGWQVNLPGAAWYGLHLWEHFAFTNDTLYLQKQAYPILKELCHYWEANLKTLGAGGKGFESNYQPVDIRHYPELADVKEGTLVVPNGWSPEHGPRGEDGVAHDQQIVSELFLNTIRAAEILGVDKEWSEQLRSLHQRLQQPEIGKEGNLMEWMIDRNPDTDHRHTSHLYAVFPGSIISPEKTPELAEAARKSLQFRKNTGDSRRSWAWGWRSMVWSRLHDGEMAHQMIEGLISYNMLDNLFATHHIPLQIDGNYGIAAAMLEMLIQSHNDVISLLPAPTLRWKEGSATGLRARGNIEADIRWKDGKVTHWKLRSPQKRKVKVLVNGEYHEVNL
jgi:alpha-L-fucosidase 2